MNIGDWIRRHRKNAKWHLVESLVAEDGVTKCGRRLDRKAGGIGLDISDVMPLTRLIGQPQLCSRCDA